MRIYRVFTKNGRPCVEVDGTEEEEGATNIWVEFDIAHRAGVRVATDEGDCAGIRNLNYAETDANVAFRPGYAMEDGCGDLPVVVTFDGEEPAVAWFRLCWDGGTLTAIEEPAVADRMATLCQDKKGTRFFFRVTAADLRAEASRDPRVAAENLIRVTLVVDTDRPLDACYVDAGMTCFDSLSQRRALDALTGLIVGFRLAGGDTT